MSIITTNASLVTILLIVLTSFNEINSFSIKQISNKRSTALIVTKRMSSNSDNNEGLGRNTIIVGLNGALQKRFILSDGDKLIPGNVHRANKIQSGIGGKGQDVAIALSCLNYQNNIQLAQFIGKGFEGDYVSTELKKILNVASDDDGASLGPLTIRNDAPLRTCTTIVTTDSSTELVEPSGNISEDEIQQLLDNLKDEQQKSEEDPIICIMGSMPPGCPSDFYSQIYRNIYGKNSMCVIDTVVGLDTLLSTMAENKCSNAVVKINASELCKLVGVSKANSEADGISMDELTAAVKEFVTTTYPSSKDFLSGLAITDGKHNAHMVMFNNNENNDDATFSLDIYSINTIDVSKETSTLYPIGAGDTVAGGTLAAWSCYNQMSTTDSNTLCLNNEISSMLKEAIVNMKIEDTNVKEMILSFTFGLACGSASCLNEENSTFDTKDSIRLFKQMTDSGTTMIQHVTNISI